MEYGIIIPSILQRNTLPTLLHKSVAVHAPTGTGSTTCAAIAVINKIKIKDQKNQVLYLVPTRELAYGTSYVHVF
jgi:superfamily II DNA/RNA helicase